MTDSTRKSSRRSFLGNLGAAALAAGATPHLLVADDRRRVAERGCARQYRSANDQINLAVIGAGGMGMADVATAVSVPGVKLVAAADVYGGRLDSARRGVWLGSLHDAGLSRDPRA